MGLRDDKAVLRAALETILRGGKHYGLVEYIDGSPVCWSDIQYWHDIARQALDDTDDIAKNPLANIIGNFSTKDAQDAVSAIIAAEAHSAYEIAERTGLTVYTVRRAVAVLRHEKRVYIEGYGTSGSRPVCKYRTGSEPDKPRPLPAKALHIKDRPGTKALAERVLNLMTDDEPTDRHKMGKLIDRSAVMTGVALEYLVAHGKVELIGLAGLTKQYLKKAS